MTKLGLTWYPKDWWTSDAFFELSTPKLKYIYLECLFKMYVNDGYIKTQKTQIENLTRTQISDSEWKTITQQFITEGDVMTHSTINKRLRKTLANRENGKSGGRPKGSVKKPKKPKNKPTNNPPLEENRIEEKEKIKKEKNPKQVLIDLVRENDMQYMSIMRGVPNPEEMLDSWADEKQGLVFDDYNHHFNSLRYFVNQHKKSGLPDILVDGVPESLKQKYPGWKSLVAQGLICRDRSTKEWGIRKGFEETLKQYEASA